MADRKFAIRFSVEDMEKVRAALKNMGDDGASALRAIERQSRQATPAMKALDTAAKDVRREFDAFANRIPVIGGALSALGPVGTGVAAALGGAAIGMTALVREARQAIDQFSALKDAADKVALSVEDLQSVRAVGMLGGISADEIDTALQKLAINSARASEGFGKMQAALEKVDPVLGRQLAQTQTQRERLDLLAKAVQSASTGNEKLNISVAAFGETGAKMVTMLDEGGASLTAWAEKARAAGLILDEDLVKSVEAMGDRIDILQTKIDQAMAKAAVGWGPAIEASMGRQAAFIELIAAVGEETKPITERSGAYLNEQLRQQQQSADRYAARIKEILAGASGSLEAHQRMYEHVLANIATIQRELSNRTPTPRGALALESEFVRKGSFSGLRPPVAETVDPAEAAKRKAEADKLAAEAARLREQQEKAAIEIRASLGDWTGKYAAEEARLNTLVAAGLLSREAMNASLAKTRGELDGSAAAVDRWKSMFASAQTPVQQAEAALAAFEAEVRKFGDRAGVNELAIRAGLVDAINDAKDAAREATPEFKAVAEARAAITAEAERLMTNQQKLDAYEAKQRALIGVNGYTWGEATKAIAAYRAELDRASQSQRDNTFELRFSAEVLTGIIDENINSLEDLGKVALRVFRQMAVEWILSNQKMAASQGIFDFIGNALTSAFTGGGAPAGGGSSAHATVGVKHSGGIIGSTPVNTRTVNGAMFIGAPRAHSGLETLRAGERPIIAEDGERMLSRVDNARVVRAIERGAGDGPRVEVHFHGAEGRPEVKESRGADGSIRLDVMMHKAALNALSSSDGAKLMAAHYGLNRAVRA